MEVLTPPIQSKYPVQVEPECEYEESYFLKASLTPETEAALSILLSYVNKTIEEARTNNLDLFEVLNAFNGDFTINRPRIFWADLTPNVPDHVINIFDLFAVSNAFGDTSYPYDGPDMC